MTQLRTERLVLSQWAQDDLEPFVEQGADPEVMRHLPSTLTPDQSEAMALGISALIESRGWGLWAVEVVGGPRFIGFVGLDEPTFEAHFTPAVEVGWRLSLEHWGQGYATEAARAAIDFAFGELGLDEIVAFTSTGNQRSRRVMERLGMTHDPADDFDHPRVPEGPLRRHALYRLGRPAGS